MYVSILTEQWKYTTVQHQLEDNSNVTKLLHAQVPQKQVRCFNICSCLLLLMFTAVSNSYCQKASKSDNTQAVWSHLRLQMIHNRVKAFVAISS